jgi:hypothetical protein
LTFPRLKHGIGVSGLPASGRSGWPSVLKLTFSGKPSVDRATIKAVTPMVLEVVPGRSLVLGAGQARVSCAGGGALPKLKFLSATDTCLGWFHVNHVVEWDLSIREPGRFEVVVETGCPRSEAGSEFRVIVDGRCWAGAVPPTEGYEDFRAQSLGSVALSRGNTVAMFLPFRQPGAAFGDFHRLILRPCRR